MSSSPAPSLMHTVVPVLTACAIALLVLRSTPLSPPSSLSTASQSEPPLVPIIDIAPLLTTCRSDADAAACRRVADEIAVAVGGVGVFRVRGHGVSDAFRADARRALHTLFAVDDAEKRRVSIAPGGGVSRGYIGVGSESGSSRFEVKEGFSYGYQWADDDDDDGDSGGDGDDDNGDGDGGRRPLPASPNALQGRNVWPSTDHLPAHVRRTLNTLFTTMTRLSLALTRGFSLALGDDTDVDYLQRFCDDGDTISLMRLFHYFPYDSEHGRGAAPGQERIGSSQHTDWGFLTLILEQQEPGLEVFHAGAWHAVPAVDGTFIVNVGDYFALLSGGRFHSPLHRVVTAQRERYSVVLFYYPNFHAAIPAAAAASATTDSAQSAHSLLHDQTLATQQQQQQQRGDDDAAAAASANSSVDADSLADVPFGAYIAAKWAQVYRDAGM